MDSEEEQAEILCKVLMALFPGAPFSVDVLAAKVLEGLGMVGWSLSYDPQFTASKIQKLVEVERVKNPHTEFVPPRPPERFS